MKIVNLFLKSIKNDGLVLKSEIYRRYLKVINVILSITDDKKITYSMTRLIKDINNCMINLINKDDLKQFIHKNPRILFIKKENKEIELNDGIIIIYY